MKWVKRKEVTPRMKPEETMRNSRWSDTCIIMSALMLITVHVKR